MSLAAQTLNISRFNEGSASLADNWKFHPGDNPKWADPKFDDSSWKLRKSPSTLDNEGYENVSGYSWYRRELKLEEANVGQNLRLVFGYERGACEVYVNGVKLGSFGSFPPHERIYLPRPISFAIPKVAIQDSDRLLIAYRSWKPAWSAHFGVDDSPSSLLLEIGTSRAIQDLVAAEKQRVMSSRMSEGLYNLLPLVGGMILIAIFSIDRRPEYLWLGVRFVVNALQIIVPWLASDTSSLTTRETGLVFFVTGWGTMVCAYYGIWTLLGARVGWWVKILLLLSAVIWLPKHVTGYPPGLEFLDPAIALCCDLTFIGFILSRSQKVAQQTRWLSLSFAPYFMIYAFYDVSALLPALNRVASWHLLTPLLDMALLISEVTFCYFLLRRFGSARMEQARLHVEMETARQVQLLLLPAQSVKVSNLDIDAVYLPAQEIGGDFFQISQSGDGSLLMIIGDVSGKGLKAALTVSLLVGLWQDVAGGSEQSPKQVLRRLNEHLLTRLPDGFVTCLCARLSANWKLTLSNAGHLAPYVNGKELSTANGLPLGISAEVEYTETDYDLVREDTLAFISDGLVEARDKNRKFFGFDRVKQALSERIGADALARSAQQFGQEDDITVVSIFLPATGTEVTLQEPPSPLKTFHSVTQRQGRAQAS